MKNQYSERDLKKIKFYFLISLFLLFNISILHAQYHVYYYGNGNDGGTPPADVNSYIYGDMAMVKWEESLTLTNYTFSCWNTEADGSGINYSPDAYSSGPTILFQNSNIILYAQWGQCSEFNDINEALQFNAGQFLNNDDVFESIVINNMPDFSNHMTIEGWINPTQFDVIEGSNNPVILKFYDDDIYIGLIKNGENHVLSWNGWTAYGTTNIPENQWTHFAIVLNNGTIDSMYINGNSETFTLSGVVSLPTSSLWVIGNMTWSSSPYRWHGMLDEIRVWSTARTTLEIQDLYNAKLNGNESGLYAYWNFDKGSTTQLLCDNSLNGNNHIGVLRNMEATDWVSGFPMQTLGIKENTVSQIIQVYPNPTNAYIKLNLPNQLNNTFFRITNKLGSVLLQGKTSSRRIDISNFNKGIYFISIIQNKNVFTQKIIKL